MIAPSGYSSHILADIAAIIRSLDIAFGGID